LEMTETATILHQATPSSLVIMDEMGRGTATFDGLSLAWSTLEYLHDGRRPRTLFATHYHELAELPETRRSLRCMQMDVATVGEDIQFLHSLSPGAAAHSYGLHVARLAGVPRAVIARASVLLKNLESLRHQAQPQPTFLGLMPEPEPMNSLSLSGRGLGRGSNNSTMLPFQAPLPGPLPKGERGDVGPDYEIMNRSSTPEPEPLHPVLSALSAVDPDTLTPLQALSLISQWRGMVGTGDG
jgi:DNA mismatch repair ATPase MutS